MTAAHGRRTPAEPREEPQLIAGLRAAGEAFLPALRYCGRWLAHEIADELAARAASDRRPAERVDVKTMAQLVDCSPAQVHRLCLEGLPFVRLGEVKRFEPAAVYAWLEQRTRERAATFEGDLSLDDAELSSSIAHLVTRSGSRSA